MNQNKSPSARTGSRTSLHSHGPQRTLTTYFALTAVTICLGLASRKWAEQLPPFIATYAGDALWTVCLFFCLAIVLRRAATWQLSCLAFAGSVLVELSQLYHAPWIDHLREYKIVALMIGSTFVWTDLVCYFAGAILAATVDLLIRR